MTAMMEEILIEPTEEWLPEAASYKRTFEAAGDSMDGTGSLRTAQDMAQWLQTCRDFKRRETTPPQLVPATQLIYVRPADHALLGMLQVRHELNDYLRLYAGHIGSACIRGIAARAWPRACWPPRCPIAVSWGWNA